MALVTVCREQTGQIHDECRHHGLNDVGTTQAREKAEVKQDERSCQEPVDVMGPEYLAEDVDVRIRHMLVMVVPKRVVW
jgi:hypothetical protein